MLRSYIRLVLFALGLLIGVQVPGFITDYAQRIEAHRLEAQQALEGFRKTATQFFGGDLDRLVAHYRASDDPVFQNDADSIGVLMRRDQMLERQWQAMQGPWYERIWHVIAEANPVILQETWAGYRYQVVLTPESIGWGLACAFLLSWIIESIALALAILILPRRKSRRLV
ncbi:Protein of unknown function (DUF2937) [Pseudomonas duriflava]|uniref:DUF2937 family protein n=1 Tax=Pseudomonas duriflava TaxID=459528 RepID=A0A562QCI6_9PSED|nr:DUF2937 family protein [Pseudomonas duriflava]TWI53736.1 Protein of unknown function (DUF2937) [Pseudomonas duriflava]